MNSEQPAYKPHDKETRRWYKAAAWRLVRRSITNQMVVGATLFFTAVAAAILFMQWTTLNQTLKETRAEFKAAQRPNVSLGGRDGNIGGLMNQTVQGKPVIALYFYNGGQSTALNFRVHIGATIPGTITPSISRAKFPHIHRYGVFNGGTMVEIISNGEANFGLAAQAEHVEYILDPALLWTRDQLNDTDGEFAIGGDIEYCDEFGTYHCQGWGAEYKPLLSMFVPNGPIDLPCVRENGGEAAQMQSWRRARDQSIMTVREIEPCKQPDEPEYLHELDSPAPSATPTPK